MASFCFEGRFFGVQRDDSCPSVYLWQTFAARAIGGE